MASFEHLYETVESAGTFTINGRAGRKISLVHTLINGVATKTVDAAIVFNTASGDAITCKPLTQVTGSATVPTQQDFNDQDTETFPLSIGENESLVMTFTNEDAEDCTVAATIRIEK